MIVSVRCQTNYGAVCFLVRTQMRNQTQMLKELRVFGVNQLL